MSDGDVIIQEAWYVCPVHGAQHRPLAPDLDTPCPSCQECLDAMGPFESLAQMMERLGEGDRFRRKFNECMRKLRSAYDALGPYEPDDDA